MSETATSTSGLDQVYFSAPAPAGNGPKQFVTDARPGQKVLRSPAAPDVNPLVFFISRRWMAPGIPSYHPSLMACPNQCTG